jgi:four helix bundle protein
VRRKHHDLLAWQQAVALVKAIYRLTQNFPRSEVYALTSQMRRAAISVPANIAEGMGRSTIKELLQFLIIARGFLSELDTYLVLARELGYTKETGDIEITFDRVFGLIGGLINANRKPAAPQ